MPDPRVLTLAIETSNPGDDPTHPTPVGGGTGSEPGVALGMVLPSGLAEPGPPARHAVEVLGVEPLRPSPSDATHARDDDLMPAIQRLCARAGVRPRDLGRVALSLGPGGFTSLRIGVMTAKMISEATGAACVGVPTPCALIRRVGPARRAGRRTAIALAWKREDAWRVIFPPLPGVGADDPGFEPESHGELVPFERLVGPGDWLLVAADPLVQRLREAGLLRDGILTEPPCFDPVSVLEASAGLPATDPLLLAPIYPREPEAVSKWRRLKGAP